MAGRKGLPVRGALFVLLEAMARQKVPSVVVGAAALALHGIPRSTLDLDLIVPAQGSVVRALFRLAHRAGFHSAEAAVVSLADRPDFLAGQWVTFRNRRSGPWVDVFFEHPDAFRALRRRAVRRRMVGWMLAVASLDDLERMKREVGRPIDLADVALIQERRRRRR